MKTERGLYVIEIAVLISVLAILGAIFVPYLKTGHFPRRHLVSDSLNSGDNAQCIGGIISHRGEIVIINSNTVRCTP